MILVKLILRLASCRFSPTLSPSPPRIFRFCIISQEWANSLSNDVFRSFLSHMLQSHFNAIHYFGFVEILRGRQVVKIFQVLIGSVQKMIHMLQESSAKIIYLMSTPKTSPILCINAQPNEHITWHCKQTYTFISLLNRRVNWIFCTIALSLLPSRHTTPQMLFAPWRKSTKSTFLKTICIPCLIYVRCRVTIFPYKIYFTLSP